ncbi:hypothetical protein F2Q68_00031877 [Brassica cretica]|uniref:Uncharacterized protein n=2 Tax=Brassica cretica TaxID=69181 RepID=A0ABQ7BPR5_BRACR|nr:hypothetical protein F2Q68_00031877 [Brassica cretica]KAF3534146.1 hypothetical protein DY000_02041786 [Brassica cretica]
MYHGFYSDLTSHEDFRKTSRIFNEDFAKSSLNICEVFLKSSVQEDLQKISRRLTEDFKKTYGRLQEDLACCKMDLPELPKRMYTLGEEPIPAKSIGYHTDDPHLLPDVKAALHDDEWEELKNSRLGVFIKF